jgi:hypothetical protein
MPHALTIVFSSDEDLRAQIAEHDRMAAMLHACTPPAEVVQFDAVEIALCLEGDRCQLHAEVLQVMPGLGIVLRVADWAPAHELLARCAVPRTVRDEPVLDDAPAEADLAAGAGPMAWPIERLQREWAQLSKAEKIRIALHGQGAARGLVLRGTDKSLHVHLLKNPQLTADEVAAMAGMPGFDPTLLRVIAANKDWQRSVQIVRNLICNPKLPMPDATRLLGALPVDELTRLTRSGKVRDALKRAIIKHLEMRRSG